MANNAYCAIALTGGGTGALDSLDGASLADGDVCFVVDAANNNLETYTLNATLGGAASPPSTVSPTTNAGNKRWELVKGVCKDSLSLYDGTNIGMVQLITNILELYSNKTSGVVRVSVTDGGSNKETAADFTGGGAARLYYDNSVKLATTSTGITVTGALSETIPAFSRRNIVINGDMNIWQRGTTLDSAPTATILADRFKLEYVTDGAIDLAQSTSVPASDVFKNSLLATVRTADAAIAAGQYAAISYIVEGYDFRQMVGKTITLSFWVRSQVTGTFCIALRTGSAAIDRSYIVEYTITDVETWEKKTITVTMDGGGSPDYTTGLGLQIVWALAAGTTWQESAGAWKTGSYLATSNQVNWLSTTGVGTPNIFSITGVQFELGSIATPFEFRPVAEELALCQRYYEKSYPIDVFAGAVSTLGEEVALSPATGTIYHRATFKVRKRIAPTSPLSFSTDGTVDKVWDATAGAVVAASYNAIGDTGFLVTWSATDGRVYIFQWTADTEI